MRHNYEYQHAFIQHTLDTAEAASSIPLDVSEGLTAWGADGWEVVHMEAVWTWHQAAQGKTWPETLRGYYVTFKREVDTAGTSSRAAAVAEASLEVGGD